MIQFILRNKILTSALFSLIYCSLILPINESIWFDTQQSDPKMIMYSRVLKLIFGVGLFFVAWFVLHFTEKIKIRNSFYISWLKSSALYGGVLLTLLLLIFPGYWSWDDFWVLDSAHTYWPNTWQHIFTQAQYIFSLYIFPSSTAITVIQLGIISTIVGYVVTYLKQFLSSKRSAVLIWLPFFTLPILFGNFYTLRLHIYGYLLLLLAIKTHQLFSKKVANKNRYLLFLGITFLITLLAFWRSEGIIFLALLPVFFVKLGFLKQLRKKTSRLRALGIAVGALMILVAGFMTAKFEDSPRYKITATINPLSMLVQKQDTSSEDWRAIDKVINVDMLKKNPDYTDIEIFWNSSFLRPNYEQYLNEYYRSFANIVMDSPIEYMKIKTKTFLSTNSLYPIGEGEIVVNGNGLLTPYSIDGCKHLGKQECGLVQRFDAMSKVNMPIAPHLRESTLDLLMLDFPSKNISIALRAIFWNVIPILLIVIVALVHALYKRKFVWVLLLTLPLAQAMIVFLTAPASFFMYYYPAYLVGSVLALFYILTIVDKSKK